MRQCPICDAVIGKNKKTFCSDKCQAIFARADRHVHRACEICGKDLQGQGQKRFCSATCDKKRYPIGHYVYGFYINHGELLYIGKGRGNRAWKDSYRPFSVEIARCDETFIIVIFSAEMESEAALALETKLIAEHRPRYNQRGIQS